MKHVILLVWLLLITSAHAASFDCTKAATTIEKQICANSELSVLDEELSAHYANLRNAGGSQANMINKSQRKWLQDRNHCSEVDCLKRTYIARISALKKLSELSGPPDKIEHKLSTPSPWLPSPVSGASHIATSGSLFVAGGYQGIASSTDGVTWVMRTAALSGGISDIIWTGKMFFAIGEDVIYTSRNGLHWSTRKTKVPKNVFSIAWSGSQFVAVGGRTETSSNGSEVDAESLVYTSPDGLTWTKRITETESSLYGIVWSGKQFVAIGNEGIILTSPDGKTWTAQNSGTDVMLSGITWTGSEFVAVGDVGTVLVSNGGVDWQKIQTGTRHALMRVIWTGTQFVTVGQDGAMLTSLDARRWMVQDSDTTFHIDDIAWSGKLFAAVSARATLTSVDGIHWQEHLFNFGLGGLRNVTKANGYFFAVGQSNFGGNGVILTSPDAVNWMVRILGSGQGLYDITSSGDQLVAVGYRSIITSHDGASWTKAESDITTVLFGVASSGKKFVAVGQNAILSSDDGLHWFKQPTGASISPVDSLVDIVWSGAKFIAVGDKGTILSSEDGINWKKEISGISDRLLGIAWSGNHYIAVGGSANKPVIITSKDGKTWEKSKILGKVKELYGVAWSGKEFVAVGDPGTILISEDGKTWTARASGVNSRLYGVQWTEGKFIAVGMDSAIFTSPDGVEWTKQDLVGSPLVRQ